MNHIHPLVKLFLTIFYIVNVVSFDKYNLMGLLGMVVYPLVMFEIAEASFGEALRKLKFVLPLVCVVGVFNPFFDREILIYIGTIPVSGGVLSMLTLMCKGIFTVLASYLLIATTTIEKICYALRMLHVPKIFVTQVLLSYRYIRVLLLEAHRMTQAYALRAPGQKGIRFGVWGTFVGQLLLRSMDRAENIYESMCLRGYDGEFYYGRKQKWKVGDGVYLLIWTAMIAVFRFCPVFEMVGSLFWA